MGDFVEITDEFGRTRRITKEEAAALEEEKKINKENVKKKPEDSRRHRSRSRSPGRKGRSRSRSPRKDRDRKYDGHRGGPQRSNRFGDLDRFDSRPQQGRPNYPPRDEPGPIGHSPHMGGPGGMGVHSSLPFQNGGRGDQPMGSSVGRGRGVNLPAWMTRGEGPPPGPPGGPMGAPPPMGPPPRQFGGPPVPPQQEFGQLQQHTPRQEPYSHQQRPPMDQQAMQGSRFHPPPLNNGMHPDVLDRPVSQIGPRSLQQPPNRIQLEPQQQNEMRSRPLQNPPRPGQEQGSMPGLAPPVHQEQSGLWSRQNFPTQQHQGGPAHPYEKPPMHSQVPGSPHPSFHPRQMGQGPFPNPHDQQPPFGPGPLPPPPMNQEQHGSREFPTHNMPPSLGNPPLLSTGMGTGSSQGSQRNLPPNTSVSDISRNFSSGPGDTQNLYTRTNEPAQVPWSQGAPQQGQPMPPKPGSGYAEPLGYRGSGTGQGVADSFQQGKGNFEQGQGKLPQGPGSFEKGQDKYHLGQGSLPQGQSSFQQGQGNYQEGQGSFQQGQVRFQQGQGSFQQSQDKHQQGQGDFQQGQQPAIQGSYQHGMSSQPDYGYGIQQQPNAAYGPHSQSVQQTPQLPVVETQTHQVPYGSPSLGQARGNQSAGNQVQALQLTSHPHYQRQQQPLAPHEQTTVSGQPRVQPGTQVQYQQPSQYQQDTQKGQQSYPQNISQGAPAEVGSNTSSATSSATSEQLPPGWQAVLDNSSNCYYYWNMNTNETSWETPKPATSQGISSAQPPSSNQGGQLSHPVVQPPSFNQSVQFQQSKPQSLNQPAGQFQRSQPLSLNFQEQSSLYNPPGGPMQQAPEATGYNTVSASISRQPELYRQEDLRGGQKQQSQHNEGQQGYGKGGLGQLGDQRQVNRSYDGPPAPRIDPIEASQQQWHDYNRSRGKGR